MKWKDLLVELDSVRADIRQKPAAAVVTHNDALLARIRALGEAAERQAAERKTVEVELDEHGNVVLPVGMAVAGTVVKEEQTSRDLQRFVGEQPPPKSTEVRAVPLPRDTPLVKHEPTLEPADETTVVKDPLPANDPLLSTLGGGE